MDIRLTLFILDYAEMDQILSQFQHTQSLVDGRVLGSRCWQSARPHRATVLICRLETWRSNRETAPAPARFATCSWHLHRRARPEVDGANLIVHFEGVLRSSSVSDTVCPPWPGLKRKHFCIWVYKGDYETQDARPTRMGNSDFADLRAHLLLFYIGRGRHVRNREAWTRKALSAASMSRITLMAWGPWFDFSPRVAREAGFVGANQ